MLADITSAEPPSLLVCGSLIPNPDDAYLSRLRSSLIHNPHLTDLREGIAELPHLWSLLVAREPSLNHVDAAPLLRSLAQWIAGGNSCALSMAGQSSKNTLLAVLTVLAHIHEYTAYLNSQEEDRDAHAINLEGVREGGIQGLCVGLLSAIALACSKDSTELGKHGAIAVRLALCVGAVVDLDEMESPEPTISLSARWPRGEGDELLKAVLDGYPQAYMGVRMDNGGATITAPKGTAMALMRNLEEKGAAVKQIDVRGRFHHQGHRAAFQKLAELCAAFPMLQFPHHSRPLVPLRRNDGGQVVTDEVSLHEMALRCILVEKADWYATMTSSVAAMAQGASGSRDGSKARVLVLGPVDCIPRSALAICPLQTVRSLPNESSHLGYPDGSIAIIGTSCRFPDSETPQEFWDMIRDRKTGSCLAAAGSFDCSLFRKSPREAEYMDPQHRLALHLAYEALESGGHFSPSSLATDNIGCYVGMSSCDYEENVNAQIPTAFSFTGTARAFASGRISHFFGLTGPSMVVDTACSSSAVAIHAACKAIQAGECSAALAGGINLMTPQARSHQNLAAASFLSPTGQCRPFDAAANGYCRGEGGGFVLLKRLSAAVADNDCIIGVLAASAINNSKGSRSITLPSSESQSHLYRCVLQKAGLRPHHVSYVEAHGTGTQKGDPVESQSIRQVFGGRLRQAAAPLRLGSVKGNIGHSEAASGLAAVVKVLLMLRHRQMPPQANFSVLNPAIPSLEEANMEIPSRLGPWEGPFRAALVNNYGASGTNAAMIVCQAPLSPSRRALLTDKPRRYPILISAHSTASLQKYCQKLLNLIEAQDGALGDGLLPSVAFCLAQRQNHSLSHRIAFSASSTGGLKNYLSSLVHDDPATAPTVRNSPKPVVLIFAGQTGRRARISHAAYHDSILLQFHLEECDRALQTLGLSSLFPRVFETEPIDDLVDLHCLLFSLQYSVAKSWIDAGLEVKALVGHSLGQLTALCVSGVLSLRDALKMISGRALLIQRNWGPHRGCMLSVDADAATVQSITQSLSRSAGVEVACYNSSTHHVVVGTGAAVTAFEDAARSRDVAVKRLPVTHGFHSEMIDCIMPEYHRLIQGLVLHRPTVPIEPCSSSSGSWDNITPELIARQSREPVYFADAVDRVEQRLGPCVWLEAGTGSTGITMARRSLTGRRAPGSSSHSFHSARLDDLDPMTSLADTTLGLWNEGIRVQFWLYHASQRCCFEPLELPPYQFERSNHCLPAAEKAKGSPGEGENQLQSVQEAPKLVSLVGDARDLGADTVEFSINQQSEEYTAFVRGRTVLGHILAPTSVYVESAARAFGLLPMLASPGNDQPSSVEVGDVKIHAPFGLDLEKQLTLTLRRRTSSRWHFVVESQSRRREGIQASKASKLQASGTVGWQHQERTYLGPQRPLLRRLYDRCEQLREDRSSSVVQGAFVKKVLGRVASYADSYFGIRSITSKGLEAVGDVVMPVIASKCCAEAIFSPPAFDNFLLIAELHASSLGDLADDRTYICNGFDAIVPQIRVGELACDSQGPWTVLSSLDRMGEKTIVCDIFVFSAGQKTLSLAIMGAKLVQIPLGSLQKALEGLKMVEKVNGIMAASTMDEKPPTPTGSPSTIATSPFDDTFGTQDVKSNLLRAGTDLEMDLFCGQTRPCFRRGSLSTTSQLTPTDDGKDVDSFDSFTKQSLSSKGSSVSGDENTTALYNLLKDHLDCSQGLSPCTPLGAIGLDSLVAIQLQSDIQKIFGKRASPMSIDENTTFSDLCGMVLCSDMVGPSKLSPLPMTIVKSKPNEFVARAAREFGQVKQDTGLFAQKTGFAGFFVSVYPEQTLLVLAYITEAFSTLGCDLRALREGDPLPRVCHTPKHKRLVARFHEILEQAGLISRPDRRSIFYRTDRPLFEARTAAELYRDVLVQCPRYHPDHQLLNVTGPRLADCLSGRVDPLQLLFQDEASIRLLQDVYVSSPMFATGNEMLGELIGRLVSYHPVHDGPDKLRIVEVGAGTGATTQVVLDRLLASNVDFTYTFTDVSVALIAGARRKLETKYGQQRIRRHVEFTPLDMEKSPPANMVHSYDLIITSNCIHATRDLRQSCANMETLLRRDGGMLCLLELTRPLSWLDCVFGLLDGWWRFDDGRTYALAGEDEWEERLRDAGFHHVDWTDDGTQESQQFRLITAWR